MTSIAKLKDRARKYEQREDWQAAIRAYQQVLNRETGRDELELELGLYNRIGDLYLRLGETDEAVSYYERAADKYAEAGLYNNAIALCNKALRHRPDRPEIFLKLSRLSAEQGFTTDARRWILDYAERQVQAGNVDAALAGLEEFADSTEEPGIRVLLAQQLAAHGQQQAAIEQLRTAHAMWLERGETHEAIAVVEKARAIDPGVDFGDDVASGPDAAPWPEADTPPPPAPGPPGDVRGLETRTDETDAAGAGPGTLGGLERFERADLGSEPYDDEEEPEPLPLLDAGDDEEEEEVEPLPLLDDGGPDNAAEEEPVAEEPVPERPRAERPQPETPRAETPRPETPLPETRRAEAPRPETRDAAPEEEAPAEPVRPAAEEDHIVVDDLGPLDLSLETEDLGLEPAPEGPEDGLDLGTLDLSLGTDEVTAEDVDVDAVLQRARELVSRGILNGALAELQILSGTDAGPEVFRHALSVVTEVIRHDANDLTALQRRVEYASRIGDRELIVDAYIDLADALARLGAETKAEAMYERVLDLDPENEMAREALGVPESEEETVDLGAVLDELDADPPAAESSGRQSDAGFSAMLSHLRAKERGGEADGAEAGDHYDLGLAFKEMGLIDEAIGEFRRALTGGEEQLKVYEELGQCFLLKGQYNVALKVFQRALQVPHTDRKELLGVYYHLGQCHEELGHRQEARQAYEMVLSIDDSFADVPERVGRL